MSRDTTPGGDRAGGGPTPRAEGIDPAGPRPASIDGIRETYSRRADLIDWLEPVDRLLVGRYRRRLFTRAEGRVLDVACGTGTNRRYLPESVEYVGVDLSPEMLGTARTQLARLDPTATLSEMDAGALGFADDSFDTVVSSLSTCTFPDPVAALREMSRVCRPGGRILLLEHGRSTVEPVARVQDWRADAHYEKHACRLNQEPLALVEAAGLPVVEARTALLGIVTMVEARSVEEM